MTLIVLEGSSLLAPDHTHLLQVFIFASWSSPPVSMRVGWAAHGAASVQGFPLHDLWLHLCDSWKRNREKETIVIFTGVCALQCFGCQSSAGTSWGMLTVTASRGIMNQECQFWSTTQNYFVVLLRGPLNGSLSERQRERAKGPAKVFGIYGLPNCKRFRQKARDNRRISALPLRYSIIKACQSMSWPDASL